MKVFMDKRIVKKIAIILIIITIFSFILTKSVKADAEQIGGKLLNPIMSLFVSLGDSAMALLQKVVYGMDESLVNLNTTTHWWSKIIVVGVTVLAVIAAVAATVFTAGAAAGVLATASAIVAGIATTVTIVGVATITFPVTTQLVEGMLPSNFYLPFYSISPERIFSNEIAMLDVDFFNPRDTRIVFSDGTYIITKNMYTKEISQKLKEDKNATVIESTATEIRSTVSKWYQILRDISLVALLSILVYIGIRILISSTSNDKAKYKQFLMDWVVAICLLFVMQYIMSGANLIVNKITDIASSSVSSGNATQPEMFVITDSKKIKSAYKIFVEEPLNNGEIKKAEDSAYYSYFKNEDGTQNAGKNAKMLVWPAENWLQQARIKLQLLNEDSKTETFVTIGWKLIYVVLVAYTVIFMFTYIKRVIYMAFLTIIAPLVALTYPIDKMNDGKAQAFNMWFKEYIFNLLLQPMHLIIYTVLVGSAMNLASKNIIYVAVCLGFMVPAEKLLRKFFGFEKAGTPGLFAGPAGAAAAMELSHRLFGKPPHGPNGKGGNGNRGNGDNQLEDKSKIKYKELGNELFQNNGQDNPGGQNNSSGQDNPGGQNNSGVQDNPGGQNNSGVQDNPGGQNNSGVQDNPGGQNNSGVQNNPDEQDFPSVKYTPSNQNKLEKFGQNLKTQKRKLRNNFRSTPIGKGVYKVSSSKVGRALSAGARHYMDGMRENVLKNGGLTVGNITKATAKKAAAISGAAILATGGAIGGVVAGEPTKGVQGAITGGVTGYKFTDAAIDTVANKVGVSGTINAAKRGMLTDDELSEKQIKQNIKDFRNNSDNKEYIRKKFNGDSNKMEDFMDNYVPICQEKGLTDMADAETFWDMRHDPTLKESSNNMILNAIKESKKQDTTDFSAKANKEYNDTLLMKSNQNQEVATNARKLIDKASKLRYHDNK